MWEQYRGLTPYHYVANNPLRLKDPSGFGFGGPMIQTTMNSEGWSYKNERKARSVGDAPHGSSHLEESFKRSLQDCQRAAESTPALTALIGSGIWNTSIGLGSWMTKMYQSYTMAQYEAEQFEAEMTLESVPPAIQLTVGATGISGVGASGNTGILILTRGPDAGVHMVNTGGVGSGVDIGYAASLSIGRFTGQTSQMTLETMNGIGANASLSANMLGSLSFNGAISTDTATGSHWIFGGIGLGVAMPTVIGGSMQTTWTQTVRGLSGQ